MLLQPLPHVCVHAQLQSCLTAAVACVGYFEDSPGVEHVLSWRPLQLGFAPLARIT